MELVERIVVMVIFNVEVYFGILNSIFYKIIVMEIKKLENYKCNYVWILVLGIYYVIYFFLV